MQVVSEVNANQQPCWRGIDTHVVCGVIEKLGTGVTLNVMRVVVTPPQLYINPVLLCGSVVHHVPSKETNIFNMCNYQGSMSQTYRVQELYLLGVGQQRGFGHIPFVRSKQQNVGTGTVHFV